MYSKYFIYTVILVLLPEFFTEGILAQWEPDIRLTNVLKNSFTSLNNTRCIAANGSVVHAVWYDERDNNTEIYYKNSLNGGTSWSADTRLTFSDSASWYPGIAVSGNKVHIVWQDRRNGNAEIYYKRSEDAGLTWSADIRITFSGTPSYYSSLIVSGNMVHIVWQEDLGFGNTEIYFINSVDEGLTWRSGIRLTNNSTYSNFPSIAVNGNFLYVDWSDFRDQNYEIYFKRSTNAGISWGPDVRLTSGNSFSIFPTIAAAGNYVHIAWVGVFQNNEIYYKNSSDFGTTWGNDNRLTYNNESSDNVNIAVANENVHLVFQDFRDLNWELYYKNSTNNGLTWNEDVRLTNNIGNSWYPSIAVSGSVLHIIWEDNRDNDYEIYYKRNLTGNVGIEQISSEVPERFSLSQNYPNPFNPSTKIRFSIPYSSSVAQTFLSVYDILGREVTILVNQQLQPGTYSVTWDASNQPSGLYFYTLTSGDYTETKRMILIK